MRIITSIVIMLLLVFGPSPSYSQKGNDLLDQLEHFDKLNDFQGSIQLEDEINALKGQPDSLMADMYSYLAGAFYDGFALDKAEIYFKRELAYRQQQLQTHNDGLYDCRYNLIFVLEESGKFEEALTHAENLKDQAIQMYGQKSPESLEIFAWCIDLLISNVYYARALRNTELQLNTLSEKNVYYPILLAKKGEIQNLQGNYKSARRDIIKAGELFQSLNMTLEALLNKSNLALSYVDQGKYAQAEVIFLEIKEGLLILEDPLAEQALYDLYNNLTFTLVALGRYDAAMNLFKEILANDEKRYGIENPDYLATMINQGMAYVDLSDYQSAEKIFENALLTDQKLYGNSGLVYAKIENNLANVYRLSGRQEAAILAYNRAETAFEDAYEENQNSDLATVQFNKGKSYLASGDRSAIKYLRKGLRMRRAILGENHPKYGEVVNYMVLYHWQQNNLKQARRYFYESFQNYFRQIDLFFSALSEEEKATFYSGKLKPTFEQFNSFAWASYDKLPELMGDVYNYQLKTKGLIMYATEGVRRRIYDGGDSLLIRQYEEWKMLKEQISKLYSTNLSSQQTQIDSLIALANRMERGLVQSSSAFANMYEEKEVTWQQVRDKLKPGEAAMEVVRFRNFDPQQVNKFTTKVYYLGLIITSETTGYPKAVLLENGVNLEGKYLNNYGNSVQFQTEDIYSYEQYWKKFSKSLKGIKQLYFSADGVYNQINVNTLKNQETGEYLINQIKIRQVTNTKELVLQNKDAGTTSNLSYFIGFPAYSVTKNQVNGNQINVSGRARQNDSLDEPITRGLRDGLVRYLRSNEGIVPLPGTKVEVEGIASIYEAKNEPYEVVLQREANESQIKAINNPKTLHIATHGFFLENSVEADVEVNGYHIGNPLLGSGLVLAGAEDFLKEGYFLEGNQDGILTAYEAMNLDLSNTDLVVLSACETGLGVVKNGEGVYGLQRAFRLAGAKSIIMSMWNVDDDATQEFMKCFYQNWMDGNNRSQAFYNAQLSLLEKYKDPFYWGSFIIIGLDE